MINHYEYAKDIVLIRHNGGKAIDTSLTARVAKAYVDAHSEPPMVLKTFSEATEEELVEMVQAADDGLIDLYEDAGWRVGQERTVSLSAIASSGTYDGVSWSVGESQPAQTIKLVLMHKGDYELVTSVKAKGGASRSTCSFVVGMKDCLSSMGYMYYTNNNSKGWNDCYRRPWCNGGFRGSLPFNIQAIFKKFKCKAYEKYKSGVITSEDYFALPAEKEVSGTNYGCATQEANALFQFEWYSTIENSKKKKGSDGDYAVWFERSPYATGETKYCATGTSGTYYYGGQQANYSNGISPFGCV